MNWPPNVRSAFGSILFFGLLPPNVKNYNLYYDVFLNRLFDRGCFDQGFDIGDGVLKKVEVAKKIEDVVGLPSGCSNAGVGSLVGACPWCKREGQRAHSKTCYAGAVTKTSKTSTTGQQIRREFEAAFQQGPESIQILAHAKPPLKRTSREAIESGQRVKRAKEQLTKTRYAEVKKEEPFFDVDSFSRQFGPNWAKLDRNIVDPAHELCNLLKDILHLIGNTKVKAWIFFFFDFIFFWISFDIQYQTLFYSGYVNGIY